MSKFTISLDAMGGDKGHKAVIKGVNRFIIESSLNRKNDNVHFLIHGDEKIIKPSVDKYLNFFSKKIDIIHTDRSIPMSEKPFYFLRYYKETSIGSCLQSLYENQCDVVLSAANTSAVVLLSKKILGCFHSISFPMFASWWPSIGKYLPGSKKECRDFIFLDSGAIMDPKPIDLFKHAVLSSILYKSSRPTKNKYVTVGLLNVGNESTKGNNLVQETNKVFESFSHSLSEWNVKYVGFLEGWDMYQNPPNVLVVDGFTGNIILKNSEAGVHAVASMFYRWAKWKKIMRGPRFYLSFASLRNTMTRDFSRPACVLGVRGLVYKMHGKSDDYAINRTISDAIFSLKSGIMNNMTHQMEILKSLEKMDK